MKVKIYTTPSCKYCKMAKEYFDKLGIDSEEIDVTVNQEALEEMVEKSHQMGVPVIEIGDEIFVGFNRSEIDKVLNQH
ncbi:MAG: glutaredoxin family protein [Candidatus Paceibacterota bacterium]